MALTSESRDQDFVILLDEVETTIVGDEGADLLAVLDELNPHPLPNSGVRLLSLYTDLLEDNSLCVRGSSERIGLPSCSEMSLLVVLVSPDLVAPVLDVLTSSTDSGWLSHLF